MFKSEKLQANNPLIIQFIEAAPWITGLVEVTDDKIIFIANSPAVEEFLMQPMGSTKGRPLLDFGSNPEQMKFLVSKYREARDLKTSVQFPLVWDRAGEKRWLQVTVMYLESSKTGDICLFFSEDQTEKKKLIEELQAERERFQLAIDGANAGLWDWNISSGEVYFSEQWKKMLGYEDEDIPPELSGWRNLLHPDDEATALQTIQKYFDKKTDEYRLEHRLRCKDGQYRWILAKGICIWDSQGNPLRMTGWHVDIHELRSTVDELKRRDKIILEQQVKIIASAKMSSLGEMAGGIAHEINNPLAIIGLSAKQISDSLKIQNFSTAQEAVQKIESTVQRIGRIVKGLRAFSRSGDNDPFEYASVEQIVNDTLELCRERFYSNQIELKIHVLPKAEIYCRAVQLSQVLLNLLNNAHDAVYGTLNAWVEMKVTLANNTLLFEISDSGKGITPLISERMMEPFFTTKDVGEGTGLGLSIAKGIVEDHGGSLQYDAKIGNTRFFFTLPLTTNAPSN